MTSTALFDPHKISIDGMRYRMSDSEMVFEENDADGSSQGGPEFIARTTSDGGLAWEQSTSLSSPTEPRAQWQTVWTIETDADFEDRPIHIVITSGLPKLDGAWLQSCQRFIEQLPTMLPKMADFMTGELASKKGKSLRHLLEDQKTELAPNLWSALFPHQSQPEAITGADLNGALKVTGLTFTTRDAPRDFASATPNTVVVDFRFLCPASEAADIMDDEAYLKFGPWVDVTGQVVTVSVKFDGRVVKFQLES